jgi:hypothetical protein
MSGDALSRRYALKRLRSFSGRIHRRNPRGHLARIATLS